MDSFLLLPSDLSERSTNDERRASPRYPLPRPVQWAPLSQVTSGKQLCLAHDISTLGIGLLLDRPLDLSTFLDIDLLDSDARAMRSLVARAVHIEQRPDDYWLIGCAFITELSRADLAPFQTEVQPAAGNDHRRWTRFPCNVETACYTCETAPGERRTGRILNISAGGIGLLLRCSFLPGTLLHFDLPGHPTRQILIRVVRLLEHSKGSWFLGCEFADQLRDDELISLLWLLDPSRAFPIS